MDGGGGFGDFVWRCRGGGAGCEYGCCCRAGAERGGDESRQGYRRYRYEAGRERYEDYEVHFAAGAGASGADVGKVRLRSRLVELVYGFVVLLVVLWWKLAAKYRDVAEKASRGDDLCRC